MQVRHNTQLLEQAIDLSVKQSAIPTLAAEAAAYEKIARANAFRRMATGAAIAVAAVGIGIGAMLVLNRGERTAGAASSEVAENLGGETSKVTPTETQSESLQPASRATEVGKTEEQMSPAEPLRSPPQPSANEAQKPDVITVDYTKFLTKEAQLSGTTWTLTSGHHFDDENSPSWDKAWCYTRRTVNGVDINVELVNRLAPDAKPQAPVSGVETLASAGLDEGQARELASKCAWLDGGSFNPSEFVESPGRPVSQEMVVQDGWDALGYDLPNMPVTNISFEQCKSKCQGDSKCVAITYNKRHSACFMKGGASILVYSEDATMAAKPAVASGIQHSSLVFAKDTVVVGSSYTSSLTKYPDCVMACAADRLCAGFNYDTNKTCTLMNAVNSSADFRGVTSGVKAAAN